MSFIQNTFSDENTREYDAFVPPSRTASQVPQGEIQLVRIPLNTQLTIEVIRDIEYIVRTINKIHCQAYGSPTDIVYDGVTLQHPPISPILATFQSLEGPQELALLVKKEGGFVYILFMAILTFSTNSEENAIDIWSVAKNPEYEFNHSFEFFIHKIKDENDYTIFTRFNLNVQPDNTLRMTEQGRLRLYTSLGFDILQGTLIRTIYPEAVFSIATIDQGNPTLFYLELAENHPTAPKLICSYIGNIKSVEGTPILMSAKRETLGLKRDIYGGFEESFKGTSFLMTTPEVEPGYTQIEDALLNNGNVPTENIINFEYTPFLSLYHMNLDVMPQDEHNNYVNFFEVPNDFVIFSVTSPGSYLFGAGQNFQNYAREIIRRIQTPNDFKSLIDTHKSTARLPLYNIKSHEEFLQDFRKEESGCNEQYMNTLYNSIIVELLGRQPIFELPTGNTEGQTKYQLDLQIYTPGMRMYNYEMMRNSSSHEAINLCERRPLDVSSGHRDDSLLAGSWKFNMDTTEFEQLPDCHLINDDNPENTLERYLQFLRDTQPLPTNRPNAKYFLFVFGCAGVTRKNNKSHGLYELLYELSHRRSVVYRFPESTTLDSEVFLDNAVFGKNLLTEYPCSNESSTAIPLLLAPNNSNTAPPPNNSNTAPPPNEFSFVHNNTDLKAIKVPCNLKNNYKVILPSGQTLRDQNNNDIYMSIKGKEIGFFDPTTIDVDGVAVDVLLYGINNPEGPAENLGGGMRKMRYRFTRRKHRQALRKKHTRKNASQK